MRHSSTCNAPQLNERLADVHFGSKADISQCNLNVRFTLENVCGALAHVGSVRNCEHVIADLRCKAAPPIRAQENVTRNAAAIIGRWE